MTKNQTFLPPVGGKIPSLLAWYVFGSEFSRLKGGSVVSFSCVGPENGPPGSDRPHEGGKSPREYIRRSFFPRRLSNNAPPFVTPTLFTSKPVCLTFLIAFILFCSCCLSWLVSARKVRTCSMCQNGERFKETQLHCVGIWLHALRYEVGM